MLTYAAYAYRYLTFAAHCHLSDSCGLRVRTQGVELRQVPHIYTGSEHTYIAVLILIEDTYIAVLILIGGHIAVRILIEDAYIALLIVIGGAGAGARRQHQECTLRQCY